MILLLIAYDISASRLSHKLSFKSYEALGDQAGLNHEHSFAIRQCFKRRA